MTTSRRGAPAAYRGYRLQALYTLDRLLTSSIRDELVLQPEGKEDLDILQGDRLIEVVQIKSYDSLTLSDLEPDKPDSFFQRVVRLAGENEQLRILLVNFGTLGPQIQKAWTSESPQRYTIVANLKKVGLSDHGVATLLERVELVSLNENEVRERVFAFLRKSLVGIDAESAFDLLNFWLYLKAEHHTLITHQEAIERISNIGRFLAERHAYHQEWFTSIVPLEELLIEETQRETLRTEYFAGTAARYEHILADLDFLRPRWLRIIENGFAQHNVVIIHAASGQGKTTLAFRYLRQHYPATWCFRIELIQDRQHVLSITRALAGFAEAVQAPMAIYVDVSPRDTDWPELIQRLAPNPLFHVLVTIREEDLRRSALPGAAFGYADVELAFNIEDAQEIFERATATLPARRFLDFDEAWDVFGGQGPLLEFVYLLTQATTLRGRLLSQVAYIREEIRNNRRPTEELRLLQLVAVASAYEARIDVKTLAQALPLPDFVWSLRQFEREYLVRLSEGKHMIEGVHPVRSRLLVEILLDPALSPWSDIATAVLPLLHEADLENFLLHAFVERPSEEYVLLSSVRAHSWQSWTGIAGAGRAQIWAAVRAYIDANRLLIHEAYNAFGSAWWIVLNFDMVGVAGDVTDEWVRVFAQMLPTPRQQQIHSLRSRQASKEDLFSQVKEWLLQFQSSPQSPSTASDWVGVAQIWSWLVWMDIARIECFELNDNVLDSSILNLDLETISNLSLALFRRDAAKHAAWLARHETIFHERMAQEYQIVALEPNDQTLTIHYLLDTQSNSSSSDSKQTTSNDVSDNGNQPHAETMERLLLVRRLLPSYKAYGTWAYGHNFGDIMPLPVDDTRKESVDANALYPSWYLSPNIIAYGLAWYDFRPNSWQEFAALVINLRRSVVIALEQLANALKAFAQQGNRQGKTSVFTRLIDFENWSRCQVGLGTRALLPKIAVDPWGLGGESQNQQSLYTPQHAAFMSHAIVTQKYNPYFKRERDYTSSLSAFFKHSIDVMITNAATAHLAKATPDYEYIITYLKEHGQKTDLAHLSIYVLSDARGALGAYQRQFRSLFSVLVNIDELEVIERQEYEVLKKLWPMWYFFAHQPGQRWASPYSQTEGQIGLAQQQLRSRLRQACAAAVFPGVRAILLEGIGPWGKETVAWIQMDLDDPRHLYDALAVLIQSLRISLGQVSHEELLSYIIQETSRYIAILPSFCGQSLNQSAWRLHTRMTIMSEIDFNQREARWKFIPQPIPDENWLRLNIQLWRLPDIGLMERLVTSVGELYVLVARLGTLIGLSDMTDAGGVVIQRFVESQAELIRERLQRFYDAITDVAERINQLPLEQLATRLAWQEVARSLPELRQLVRPSESNPGQPGLAITDIAPYVSRLEQAAGMAEAVKLFWLSAIISREDV